MLAKVLQFSCLCKYIYIKKGKTGTGPALRSKPSGFHFRTHVRAIFDILEAKAKCKANLRVIYCKMYDVVKEKS